MGTNRAVFLGLVTGSAVGAAVWFIGLSPALFWLAWVLLATGTAVAVMWRPFMQFFHAKKRIRE